MTVRSATLSAGVVTVAGYNELLRGPANETFLIKGIYACNNAAAAASFTFYLWGPAGGGGLNIVLGSGSIAQLAPWSAQLWIPLMPGWRIGLTLGAAPSFHFAITGSVLYGVATGITYPFPVLSDGP